MLEACCPICAVVLACGEAMERHVLAHFPEEELLHSGDAGPRIVNAGLSCRIGVRCFCGQIALETDQHFFAMLLEHMQQSPQLHQEQHLLWHFGLWTPKSRKILGATFDQD